MGYSALKKTSIIVLLGLLGVATALSVPLLTGSPPDATIGAARSTPVFVPSLQLEATDAYGNRSPSRPPWIDENFPEPPEGSEFARGTSEMHLGETPIHPDYAIPIVPLDVLQGIATSVRTVSDVHHGTYTELLLDGERHHFWWVGIELHWLKEGQGYTFYIDEEQCREWPKGKVCGWLLIDVAAHPTGNT